jgi:hypothetical protein
MVACSPVPSTPGTSSSRTVSPNVSKSQSDESSMVSILKSIQDYQKKQDDKINSLTGKMSDIMNDYQYDNYEDYDHENNDHEGEENEGEPQAKKQKNETNNNTDNEKTSRFSNMAKRFKVKDVCGEQKMMMFCGRTHGRRNCPAFGKECHVCNKKNHFAKYCMSTRRKKVDALQYDSTFDDSCDDELFIGTVSVDSIDYVKLRA